MFVLMCDFSHCKQGFGQQEASESHCGPAGQSVLSPLLMFFYYLLTRNYLAEVK